MYIHVQTCIYTYTHVHTYTYTRIYIMFAHIRTRTHERNLIYDNSPAGEVGNHHTMAVRM